MLALLLALCAHAHDVEITWLDQTVVLEDVATDEPITATVRSELPNRARRGQPQAVDVTVVIEVVPANGGPTLAIAVEATDARNGELIAAPTMHAQAGQTAEFLAASEAPASSGHDALGFHVRVDTDPLPDNAP